MGKAKLLEADDQYSDCEIADRAEINSDESDGEGANDQTKVPGPSEDCRNGEEHLNPTQQDTNHKNLDLDHDSDIYGDQDGNFYQPEMDNIRDTRTEVSDLTEPESEWSHAGHHHIFQGNY